MKWIMEGNRGLVYVRVMRTGSAVLYGPDTCSNSERARDAGSGGAGDRGQQRPRRARSVGGGSDLSKGGIGVTVVDMPSIDDGLLLQLVRFGKAADLRRTEQRLHLAEFPQGLVPASWSAGRGRAGSLR